jgi:MFS superfamily sulfate permease-like transporter
MAGPVQVPPVLKRPTGITIICVLWFFGGLINFFGGLSSLGDDLNALSMLGSFPSEVSFWASWAIPLETMLVAATVIMGLLQFGTIYGLWNGKRWSHKYAVALPAGFLLVNWAETLLLMTAPASLGAWPDFTTVIFGTVIAAIVISYLKKEHVKKYLGGE